MKANSYVYDLSDFKDFLDLNRFQFCHISFSGSVLAVATSKCLILTDEIGDCSFGEQSIKLAVEFNDDSGSATHVSWVIEGIVCVGFETGLTVFFNCKGEEVFEFKGRKSSVQSIKVSPVASDILKGHVVWILYEEGVFVSVRIDTVFSI